MTFYTIEGQNSIFFLETSLNTSIALLNSNHFDKIASLYFENLSPLNDFFLFLSIISESFLH